MAEGGALLRRYTGLNPYRGFESLSLRQNSSVPDTSGAVATVRMDEHYLWLKFLHIFVAVVALGTSASLGIVLEFFANDRRHGSFALLVIERMTALVVFPGYLLMLVTGLWMANSAWPFTATWIQLAVGLWALGLPILGWSFAAIRKQRRLHAAGDYASAGYRWAFIASRVSGGAFGLVVVTILYLMVFKP